MTCSGLARRQFCYDAVLNRLEYSPINGLMSQTFENRLALAQVLGKLPAGGPCIQVLLKWSALPWSQTSLHAQSKLVSPIFAVHSFPFRNRSTNFLIFTRAELTWERTVASEDPRMRATCLVGKP